MLPNEPHDPILAGIAGTRIEWRRIPGDVRASVEDRLGCEVERAVSQEHGFSPALAARLLLTNGGRVFVKAIGPDDQSGAPGAQELYRQEGRIAAGLPMTVPAPRLIDRWETADWTILLFEDVDGHHPAFPWDQAELDRVLSALADLRHDLTPSPVPVPPAAIPGDQNYWSTLAEDPSPLNRLTDLDPWVLGNVGRMAELEATTGPAFAGRTLLHADIRADNILITEARVVLVDWPHARVGAPWLDLLFFLPSVAMQGGPEPNEVFWKHPVANGVEPESVLAVLTGLAGFFVFGATLASQPGLPPPRRFQLAQGAEAIKWLRRMLR